LIDIVGDLLDEPLTHQSDDNCAQRRALDQQDALQLALPGRSSVHELVQHIPLGRPQVVGP
jgi:hypothetical protein